MPHYTGGSRETASAQIELIKTLRNYVSLIPTHVDHHPDINTQEFNDFRASITQYEDHWRTLGDAEKIALGKDCARGLRKFFLHNMHSSDGILMPSIFAGSTVLVLVFMTLPIVEILRTMNVSRNLVKLYKDNISFPLFTLALTFALIAGMAFAYAAQSLLLRVDVFLPTEFSPLLRLAKNIEACCKAYEDPESAATARLLKQLYPSRITSDTNIDSDSSDNEAPESAAPDHRAASDANTTAFRRRHASNDNSTPPYMRAPTNSHLSWPRR